MNWDEYTRWLQGETSAKFYQDLLVEAETAPERNADRAKIIKAHQMPWENSPHGLLKHIVNDKYLWKPEDEEKRFEWEAGDLVYIPPNTISQHFNADPEKPARIAVITNRIYRKSGLNDLEQIENAPEYDPNEQLTAERLRRYLQVPSRR